MESGRAIGTVLAGPALESIKAGKAHYGEVPILGTPYVTGYEPIKDGAGATIVCIMSVTRSRRAPANRRVAE
jgi:hypothetical protein